MKKPKYVKVNNELFPINTDFRIALKCNEVGIDENIGDYERALAIIYLLFGEKGLNATTSQNELLEYAIDYLTLGRRKKELKNDYDNQKFQLDFKKCEGLIKSSFKFDYGYDPYELDYLHWYDFYNDLENLSTSEFGTCCALNRVNEILNRNPSDIKDRKSKSELIKAQKELTEKYCIKKKVVLTEEQEKNSREFYEALGIKI